LLAIYPTGAVATAYAIKRSGKVPVPFGPIYEIKMPKTSTDQYHKTPKI
jgi:hypothetical protein